MSVGPTVSIKGNAVYRVLGASYVGYPALFFSGAKSVFLFEQDMNEVVNGAVMSGEVSVTIDIKVVKISGSASFKTVNNDTYHNNKLKVKFHGDFLIGEYFGFF